MTENIIGPLDLDDLSALINVAVRDGDIAPIPGDVLPPMPLSGGGTILYWYRTPDPTEVDMAAVLERWPGFWFVQGGNDYTGWNCQDWGAARYAKTLDGLIRFGLRREDRERWGLLLEEDK